MARRAASRWLPVALSNKWPARFLTDRPFMRLRANRKQHGGDALQSAMTHICTPKCGTLVEAVRIARS
jgi:hypothetical protein